MTVLLLSPVGLDRHCWESVDLCGRDVVTHDFPGFGGRARSQGALTAAAWADDIADAVGGDLDVVGVSLGGMVAQHFALRYPERVHSLFLACTGVRGRPGAAETNINEAEKLGMPGLVGPTLSRWFTASTLGLRPVHPGVSYARRTLLALDSSAYADGWRVIATHDLTGKLGTLRCPVTCAAAEEDVAAPRTRVEELARSIAGARFTVIDGPHMAHLEQPAAFSRALGDHLDWAHGRDASAAV
ncbi:MAG TPA: alpha/beta hydrolase [Trebonia sp.]|nr:alpha/beta hydrolase [Trebonia sp.]